MIYDDGALSIAADSFGLTRRSGVVWERGLGSGNLSRGLHRCRTDGECWTWDGGIGVT